MEKDVMCVLYIDDEELGLRNFKIKDYRCSSTSSVSNMGRRNLLLDNLINKGDMLGGGY